MTFDDVVKLKGLVEHKDYPYETLREIWNEAVKSCSEFVGDNYGWPNVDGKPYAYYADNLGEEMLKKMSSNARVNPPAEAERSDDVAGRS